MWMAVKVSEIYPTANFFGSRVKVNPLNAELNPICHLLALLGAHLILQVSRIRVKVYFTYKAGNLIPEYTVIHYIERRP
jgi:hypothetical protein